MLKTAFVLLMGMDVLLACSGDCVLCHPKLLDAHGKMDANHQVLTRCKQCHVDGTKIEILDKNVSRLTVKNIKLIPLDKNETKTSHTECGADCWQCHDIRLVSQFPVAEHQGLQKCIDCHVSIDKEMLNGGAMPFGGTLQGAVNALQ